MVVSQTSKAMSISLVRCKYVCKACKVPSVSIAAAASAAVVVSVLLLLLVVAERAAVAGVMESVVALVVAVVTLLLVVATAVTGFATERQSTWYCWTCPNICSYDVCNRCISFSQRGNKVCNSIPVRWIASCRFCVCSCNDTANSVKRWMTAAALLPLLLLLLGFESAWRSTWSFGSMTS